jgi:protein gp37
MGWAILGGESGTNSRLLEKEWAIDILNQCVHYDIPFFFNQ